jgi:hypothetical protein
MLHSIALDLFERVYAVRDQRPWFKLIEVLAKIESASTDERDAMGNEPTSWKLHVSTLPGSFLDLSITQDEVKSLHRASTALPFFSLDTYMHAKSDQIRVRT